VILKGIENAKPLAEYRSYRDQGFVRQFVDWLVGMNLTHLVKLKSKKPLHFRRVQTAVLGAVYEWEKSITSFTPEKYFEIRAFMNNISDPTDNPSFPVKIINPDNEDHPTRFMTEQFVL
jgi:DNA topoisomerase IA